MAKKAKRFWHSRWGALVLSLIALVLAYLMASRAIDTGSWQQYGLTLLLLIFAVNRFSHAAHRQHGHARIK